MQPVVQSAAGAARIVVTIADEDVVSDPGRCGVRHHDSLSAYPRRVLPTDN